MCTRRDFQIIRMGSLEEDKARSKSIQSTIRSHLVASHICRAQTTRTTTRVCVLSLLLWGFRWLLWTVVLQFSPPFTLVLVLRGKQNRMRRFLYRQHAHTASLHFLLSCQRNRVQRTVYKEPCAKCEVDVCQLHLSHHILRLFSLSFSFIPESKRHRRCSCRFF